MRTVPSQNDTVDLQAEASAEKRFHGHPTRVRLIRLDRHIRQAEWADRLKGRC